MKQQRMRWILGVFEIPKSLGNTRYNSMFLFMLRFEQLMLIKVTLQAKNHSLLHRLFQIKL